MTPLIKKIRALNVPRGELWISEALFGFNHIEELLSKTSQDAEILEIGCGSGILLSICQHNFPEKKYLGLEPFGTGFDQLRELNKISFDSGIHIHNIAYEKYDTKKQFDLIYSINVFEHLDDWRHNLRWIDNHLKPGGVFVTLQPNYSFPYEPHFGIPILFNKMITKRFFNSFIKRHEKENNAEGLWDSLNFVTKRQVRTFLKQSTVNLSLDDQPIVEDMINRLATDYEYANRQKLIGYAAKTIKATGLLKLNSLFSNYLPYMKLVFTKN